MAKIEEGISRKILKLKCLVVEVAILLMWTQRITECVVPSKLQEIHHADEF